MALLTKKQKKDYDRSLQKKWIGGFIFGSILTGLIVYNIIMTYILSIINQ